MKKNTLLFAVGSLIVILACQSAALAPTAAPTATQLPKSTNTPAPTSTNTPRPTSTSLPTATQVPPTPTAAQVGEIAANDQYEISVVNFRKLETVYLDETSHWVANPGYQFAEIGIKVKNLTGSPVKVGWGDVYIIDSAGTWYPGWGLYKAVANGIELNPRTFSFAEIKSPDEPIEFNDVAFLRAIWLTPTDNSRGILVGFDDSPLVQVMVK